MSRKRQTAEGTIDRSIELSIQALGNAMQQLMIRLNGIEERIGECEGWLLELRADHRLVPPTTPKVTEVKKP